MLTVRDVCAELDLRLAAGEEAAGAPLRWVHITELPDPTPWLSGGELLLTTGIQLTSAKEQRAFVRRLAGHGLAGLGFATGFDHAQLPPALVEEAGKLGFPLFEVPYELPFIAITEKAFARLVNEQYETLQRGTAIHKRLERIVLEERGLEEVVRALAGAIGGMALVLDGHEELLAESDPGLEPPDGALRLPVATRSAGTPQAWLVAWRDSGALGDFERLILQQAVTVVALELMRRRVMSETERRLAGDVLAEAIGGRLDPAELETRLRPFGVGAEAAVLVFAGDDPGAAAPALERALADEGARALVAPRDRLLCAVVDAAAGPPEELAARVRGALGGPRAAASRPSPVAALRRSFHEARCALEAAGMANGSAPAVATWRDLGAFQLLLSLQDDEALRLYCDSVLGPLEGEQGEYGDELVRSLEVFLESNGHWERAARALPCHRHTLRYRIKRVEEITGRDLSRARDRIEFWLALRGKELIG